MRSGSFSITFDTCFLDVINHCRFITRKGQFGTWITDEIVTTYHELHKMGYAHSVEVWKEGTLVGGLYGLSLGCIFMGESMFSKESNASKMALISLSERLLPLGFTMIDCQLYNPHLATLGAVEIPRPKFLEELALGLESPTWMGTWEL
jgi:leucyl/phenylalanyl-tRNA--protein transferase